LKPGFDNRLGENHVTGIYRWIDIIYKNRLINHGKLMVIEFLIPEPAKLYKRVMKWDLSKSETTETNSENIPPQSLEERGILSYTDISVDTYLDHVAYYGATVNEPLPIQMSKSQVFQGAGQDHNFSFNSIFPIDPGYEPHNFHGLATFKYKGRKNSQAHLNLSFTAVGSSVNWTGYDSGGGSSHGEISFQRTFNTPQSNSFTMVVGVAKLTGPLNFLNYRYS